MHRWANASNTSDVKLVWKNAAIFKYYESSGSVGAEQAKKDDVFQDSLDDMDDAMDREAYRDVYLEIIDLCPDGLPESKTGKGFTLEIKKNGGNPVLTVSVGIK